jgi:predicted GH43/DUF377 family glycosyl hydrolase
MILFNGALLLAYRYHRSTSDSRCGIAICELNKKTLQPKSKSQPIKLPEGINNAHHEDCRLFIFKGDLYVSYTEMSGYQPGVGYNCSMKYSLLKNKAGKWVATKTWQPRYGENDGHSKEKNWVFFECDGKLHCFYQGQPKHIVLELDGDNVVNEYVQPAPSWSWGQVRGGASPVRVGDVFIHVFHSSLPTEIAPHYVRYYAATYTFSAKPPFSPVKISSRPLLTGSELDGHRVDPRYVNGWKPYVVFPCGLVNTENKWLISIGVNDWACAVVEKDPLINMVDAYGLDTKPRYFMRQNGSIPERTISFSGNQAVINYMNWEIPKPGPACTPGIGYMRVGDERIAEDMASRPEISEISAEMYRLAMR